MTNRLRKIKCYKCGHEWHVDLDKLDKKDLVIHKGAQSRKKYKVKCPNCHVQNVFEA